MITPITPKSEEDSLEPILYTITAQRVPFEDETGGVDEKWVGTIQVILSNGEAPCQAVEGQTLLDMASNASYALFDEPFWSEED